VEGPAGGAAETIDRLVGIADREYVCLLPPKQLGQLNLGDVGVLELVDQNEAGIFLRALQHGLTAAEQIDRARDDVAEGSQPFLLQQVFDIMEDARDLATALEHLLVRHRRGIFRLAYARQRNLAALQTSDVGVVVVRGAQLIMATAEEFQQMLEELSRVRRLDEALEWQILNAASQQDLQVFLVDKRKLNVSVVQQSVAIGVKSVRPQAARHQLAYRGRLVEVRIEDLANPRDQLCSRIAGIGDGKNFLRPGRFALDEVGDASRQHGGFAGARARHHQHGTMHMLDGPALLIRRLEV